MATDVVSQGAQASSAGRSPGLLVPVEYSNRALGDLTRDELFELLELNSEGGIRVTFSGKTNARRLARRVRPRVTRTVKKLGIGTPEERSLNLLIEGDNLQAMVTLYRWRGRVNLILTDPPYNTGNDFRYNDKWEDDPNDPGLGEFVTSEDGGRHTKWMRFMWPRLQMMKSMLRPGGVLAICIDHRELFRLGQMLDELFGEQNRLAIINWQRAATRRNDKGGKSGGGGPGGGVSVATEYVLVYAKDKSKSSTGLEERSDEGYSNPDGDPRGDWTGVAPWAPGAKTHRGMVYGVQSPFTGLLHYPPGNQCWANEKPQVKKLFEEWGVQYEERQLDDGCVPALVIKGCGDPTVEDFSADRAIQAASATARKRLTQKPLPQLYFTKRGLGRPRKKTYLSEVKAGFVPTTYWAADELDEAAELGPLSWPAGASGTSEAGNRELSAIVGADHGYETVKPLKLFEKIIQIWAPPDGVVLDCFGGSGTTGHAVLSLNRKQDAGRRFILIEQGRPERGDSYARTLTTQRLQRAITGAWDGGPVPALGGGFEFVQLGKKVDASALLQMERDEMVDTVIASHFDANRRRGDQLVPVGDADAYRYLVARNADDEGFFLVWDGHDRNTDFTEEVYESCADEALRAGLKASTYHVYARLYRFQVDGVRFYQIPDRILADFGLDIRSEPFADDAEE